jgi:hypothetical protein
MIWIILLVAFFSYLLGLFTLPILLIRNAPGKKLSKINCSVWFYAIVAVLAIAGLWICNFTMYSRIEYTVLIIVIAFVFIKTELAQD